VGSWLEERKPWWRTSHKARRLRRPRSASHVARASRQCRGEALPRPGRRPASPLQSPNARPGRPCYDKPNRRRDQKREACPSGAWYHLAAVEA
jgi:hypothetical protein